MNTLLQKSRIFNGNTLKIIAMLLMVVDHFGYFIVPCLPGFTLTALPTFAGMLTATLSPTDTLYLATRLIGRLAFPLFAFFLAEGCRYTKDKLKHFLLLFSAGVLMAFVVWQVDKSEMNVFVTFSFSVATIYALQYFKKCLFSNGSAFDTVLAMAAFASSVLFCWFFTNAYQVDYGFWGTMLPVFLSLFDFRGIEGVPAWLSRWDRHTVKLLCLCVGLFFLSENIPAFGELQYFSYLSVPLLLLYNGKKGKLSMKYFFYIFYPAHVLVLLGLQSVVLFLLH